MNPDLKVRLAVMVVSAGIAVLAAHGLVSPLDGIGVGPH